MFFSPFSSQHRTIAYSPLPLFLISLFAFGFFLKAPISHYKLSRHSPSVIHIFVSVAGTSPFSLFPARQVRPSSVPSPLTVGLPFGQIMVRARNVKLSFTSVFFFFWNPYFGLFSFTHLALSVLSQFQFLMRLFCLPSLDDFCPLTNLTLIKRLFGDTDSDTVILLLSPAFQNSRPLIFSRPSRERHCLPPPFS